MLSDFAGALAARVLAAAFAPTAIAQLAALIVLIGAGAEIYAIVALYQQHIASLGGLLILFGTIFLVIETARRPAMALLRTVAGVVQEENAEREQALQAYAKEEGTSAEPPVISPPETGETDTPSADPGN